MSIPTKAQIEKDIDVARARTGVTFRSVVLGVVTIVVMGLWVTEFGWHLIKSYMPIAALLPLVVWVVLNTVLKLVVPRFALSRTELLTIFSMVWIMSSLPATGWAGYMIADIATPAYFASPENRVREVVPFLPDWLFPEDSPEVIVQLFEGLKPGASIPWGAWFRGGQA